MKELIKKYLEGHATEKEMNEILAWLRQKGNSLVFRTYKLEWKNSLGKTSFPVEDREDWFQIQEHIHKNSYKKSLRIQKLNTIFKVAAVFFFTISLSIAAYYYMNGGGASEALFTNIIAEKGQIAVVELPDGSKAWLNSGSKIQYNNSFVVKNRLIKIEGEGYFQIAKNPELPLLVDCDGFKVKVLGTKFNVSAYPETEMVDVVLEEGAVELLNDMIESFSYSLKPGERAKFNHKTNELVVSKVNTSRFTSWKEGIINIYNLPLSDIVKKLEIRYNQKFKIDDDVKNIRYTFTIKNEPLHEIIRLMEKITPVNAVQEKEYIHFKTNESKMKNAR